MRNLLQAIYSMLETYIEILRPYLCNHNWEYWHVKLRCDHHKSINNNILNNNIRKCSTCQKQQRHKMTPGNCGWVYSTQNLPTDTRTIEQWVNVIGKKNKHQIREERINKILKNG